MKLFIGFGEVIRTLSNAVEVDVKRMYSDMVMPFSLALVLIAFLSASVILNFIALVFIIVLILDYSNAGISVKSLCQFSKSACTSFHSNSILASRLDHSLHNFSCVSSKLKSWSFSSELSASLA